MTPEDSLDKYRRVARARPELDAHEVTPSDETVLAADRDQSQGATPGSEFPDNYEIVEQLAETQLSVTWKAFDRERNAFIVIKEPQARLLVSAEALERFRREVQLVSQLSHPNVVPILATHLSEPPYFYTMPFIEGAHLDKYCENEGLSTQQRLQICLKVCEAVMHAHQHGIIHRDLKPNNILVGEEGEPQLLDFGLGRVLQAERDPETASQRSAYGSPGYMAPEQASGLPGDVRTDVYSLGAVLYRLLTGQLPIEPGEDVDAFLRRIQEEPPPCPSTVKPELDRELDALLLKALEKEPAARYQTAESFSEELQAYLETRPLSAVPHTTRYIFRKWVARHRFRVAAGAAVVFVTILAFVTAAALWLQQKELGRHRLVMLSGVQHTRLGEPARAAEMLWGEHLRYDSLRTRVALWEFYLRFPCAFAVQTPGRPRDIEYSADGRWILVVSQRASEEAGGISVFGALTGHLTHAVPAAQAMATRIALDPVNDGFLVARSDGGVSSWHISPDGVLTLDSNSAVAGLPKDAPDSTIVSMAVSSNGRCLALGFSSGDVLVCKRHGGRFGVVHHWSGVYAAPNGLSLSADGSRLLSATRLGQDEVVDDGYRCVGLRDRRRTAIPADQGTASHGVACGWRRKCACRRSVSPDCGVADCRYR